MSVDVDKRSMVKNLCSWAVSFRLPNSKGEVFIDSNKKQAINNWELITLIENGNVLFCGSGNGNHARIYIENDELRKQMGFDSEDGKTVQFVLTDNECKRIIEYKTFSTFKKHVQDEIIANHEKRKIIEYARKVKLNDYNKISFLEKHCDVKFKEE